MVKYLGFVGGAAFLLGCAYYLQRKIYGHQEIDPSNDKRSNQYFPVQSDSEMAAGHPIVGVS